MPSPAGSRRWSASALRGLLYRLILRMDGIAAIENGVRLRFADQIRLGRNVYLDQGVYLHACPQGITLGDNTFVMHGAVLHVYNFRDLPHAFIRIGQRQPDRRVQRAARPGRHHHRRPGLHRARVQILAVNHVYDDPTRPMVEQGITAEGIAIEDDVWIGAGAIITDGVRDRPGRRGRRRRGGDRRRAAAHRRRAASRPACSSRSSRRAGSRVRRRSQPSTLEEQR